MGVNYIIDRLKNFHEIPEPIPTHISTQDIAPEGWIWLGALDNTSISSNSDFFGKNLIDGKGKYQPVTIEPGIVPSEGALVELVTGVNLRKDKPRLTASGQKLGEFVEKLDTGQKLIVLKVEFIRDETTLLVWAEVAKCIQNCD